nr:sulfurtransferase TusA family protein [Cellulosimicrobium cellulans]
MPPGRDDAVVVDARGLRCPLPVVRLAAAARDGAPGDRLVVWSTDPAARHDVPAWARMRGHAVVEDRELAPTGQGDDAAPSATPAWAITVELRPARPS